MKKIIIIILLIISIKGISQTPGFKIINSEPLIKTNTNEIIQNKKFLDSVQLNYLKGERKTLDSILNKIKKVLKINSLGNLQSYFTGKEKLIKIDSIKLVQALILENKIQQDFLVSQIKTNKKDKSNIFNTPEIIDYNYLKKEKNILINEFTKLKNGLYDNSKDDYPNSGFKKEVIEKTKARIKFLNKKIDSIKHKQDSLYHIYTKDFLQYKRVSYFSFGPKRTKAFFDIVNGNTGKRFQVLNNTGFNIGNNTGSIYSEIASGNLGILRVSLGAMVSSSSSDSLEIAKKEEAYQRLITSGGNTVLKIEYPLAYIHTRNNQYNFISRVIAKGSADFPELGTNTEKWAGSGSFGLDFYADASVDNNSLRFYANYNINQVYGTSTFIDNLDINKPQFTLGQLTLGLVVNQNVKLSFIVKTWSSEQNLKNSNVIAGGQFLH
jgi:hypothetical protein